MARDLADDTYYTVQSKGGKIPVKWTAPEVSSRPSIFNMHALSVFERNVSCTLNFIKLKGTLL